MNTFKRFAVFIIFLAQLKTQQIIAYMSNERTNQTILLVQLWASTALSVIPL